MFRLLYGVPRDILTVGGYSAWRFAGFFSIIGAVWGLLAMVAALRGEEDAGRTEIVLAGSVGRGPAFVAAVGAVLGAVVVGVKAKGAEVVAQTFDVPSLLEVGVVDVDHLAVGPGLVGRGPRRVPVASDRRG